MYYSVIYGDESEIFMCKFKREDVKRLLEPVVQDLYNSSKLEVAERDLYKNTLDCFSAVLEASVLHITLEEWLLLEIQRQQQKSMQNAIGDFHQKLIGTIDGVQDLGASGGVDIRSEKKKIIAEIKNKHNTVKGDNKADLYLKLQKELDSEYNQGFTAYFVEVLSKKGKRFNIEFTATKNEPTGKEDEEGKQIRKKTILGPHEKIRHVDIRTFYKMLGIKEIAIYEVYKLIPKLVTEILKETYSIEYNSDFVENNRLFQEFFSQAYPLETFEGYGQLELFHHDI